MLLSCGVGNCIVSLLFVCEVVALIGRGGNTGATILLTVVCGIGGLGGTIGVYLFLRIGC